MSITLSTQSHLFPFSGTTGFEEGDGMSTRIAMDMVKMCNNLWGYVDLKVVFARGSSPNLSRSISTGGASREIYIAQTPTIVPLGAKRLVWTAGFSLFAEVAATTTITSATVYLASRQYVGAGPSTAFDVTALPLGYKTRNVAIAGSVTNGESAYLFLDDSTTGMVDPPRWWGVLDSFTPGAYLILTATGTGSGVEALVRVKDFTAWFLPE